MLNKSYEEQQDVIISDGNPILFSHQLCVIWEVHYLCCSNIYFNGENRDEPNNKHVQRCTLVCT